jgi:hypothetical protein
MCYSTLTLFAAAALAIAVTQQNVSAQEQVPPVRLQDFHIHKPWQGGTHADAAIQALAGATIPMFNYSIVATKDGTTRTGTMVGTSPFTTPASTSISVVVVPLKITIGSATFDPRVAVTGAKPCDGGVAALTRLGLSPLVVNVPNLTFNGINVGTTQYIDGFRRAEFWGAINGSANYHNSLVFTPAAAVSVTLPAGLGSVSSSGCTQQGTVPSDWLDSYLQTEVTALTSKGIVGPTKFVFFLMNNVVMSTTTPGELVGGFHRAIGPIGSPVQTYAIADWDTTGNIPWLADGSIVSHEIAEWMDDPLLLNTTPAWGNIGQEAGRLCPADQDALLLEVGDPLTGTFMPAYTMNGKAYHMQELAFFSWFFNDLGTPSLGAGGKFSGNGTFPEPSKACSVRIRFLITTGGDNAGDNGSSQTADISVPGGGVFTLTLRKSGDPNWGNGSFHEVDFPIPATDNNGNPVPTLTQTTGLTGVRINQVQSNLDLFGVFADNWDIKDLQVSLFNPGGSGVCQLALVGTSVLQDNSIGLVRLSKNADAKGSGPHSPTYPAGPVPGC